MWWPVEQQLGPVVPPETPADLLALVFRTALPKCPQASLKCSAFISALILSGLRSFSLNCSLIFLKWIPYSSLFRLGSHTLSLLFTLFFQKFGFSLDPSALLCFSVVLSHLICQSPSPSFRPFPLPPSLPPSASPPGPCFPLTHFLYARKGYQVSLWVILSVS